MFFFGTFTHRHEKDAKTDADLGWRDADQWEVVQSIFQCFQEELNFRRCWNERMIINIVMEWESFSFYLSIQLEPDRPLLLVPEWGVICDGSECEYIWRHPWLIRFHLTGSPICTQCEYGGVFLSTLNSLLKNDACRTMRCGCNWLTWRSFWIIMISSQTLWGQLFPSILCLQKKLNEIRWKHIEAKGLSKQERKQTQLKTELRNL